ncbi:HNH endonuclease [Burkholderia cenocepacia]|uniref:HNH endonuclease n=1 Tax=Burkholderia cenocepacia TaxID=95486 RepID=UPI003D196826
MITQEQLGRLVTYDPATGLFVWKVARKKCRPGDVAGRIGARGYVRIKINHTEYAAHRLAFLYMTGAFPEYDVDHKNRIRSDNRWENLRPATHAQNQHNKGAQRNNVSGFVGVSYFSRTGKWRARCKLNGREYPCGYHATAELANAAVMAKRAELHGSFAREVL